jgi:putative transposase
MKRKRFTEEQIIGVLNEHELGAKTSDLCRSTGSVRRPSTTGRASTVGWDVSEAKRLKALETERTPS